MSWQETGVCPEPGCSGGVTAGRCLKCGWSVPKTAEKLAREYQGRWRELIEDPHMNLRKAEEFLDTHGEKMSLEDRKNAEELLKYLLREESSTELYPT